jgi:hypothetical protein
MKSFITRACIRLVTWFWHGVHLSAFGTATPAALSGGPVDEPSTSAVKSSRDEKSGLSGTSAPKRHRSVFGEAGAQNDPAQKIAPERCVLFNDIETAMNVASQFYHDPRVQRQAAQYPGSAVWMFRTARGRFMHGMFVRAKYAMHYAQIWELSTVGRYDGQQWELYQS